ncbi:MAG: type II toxin-antitoxin system YafQ family toxin [Peptococcaceae bacterium]|nr:type II toxin-antitoxin system YafQ family toxin [Peptococcaceae bacterium]
MMYDVWPSKNFRNDLKRIQKRGYNIALLEEIITTLAEGKSLPEKNRDHALTGNFKGLCECHIAPDWLLVYEYCEEKLYLYLTRTSTHSDIF